MFRGEEPKCPYSDYKKQQFMCDWLQKPKDKKSNLCLILCL
jgi:hypothetical protein